MQHIYLRKLSPAFPKDRAKAVNSVIIIFKKSQQNQFTETMLSVIRNKSGRGGAPCMVHTGPCKA